jgi:hypothetical protein
LPSPEARSLLRGHFEGFAWGIIDGNLVLSSVVNGLRIDAIFAICGLA